MSAVTGTTSVTTRLLRTEVHLWTARLLTWKDYQDFLKGEVRYLSLTMKNPDRAATLFARNEKEAKERYEHLSKLVALYGND